MKTFIKWPGNKSSHLRHIVKHIPNTFNTYIEPFVGSGAVFLYLQPEKWIINDINKDLMIVWKSIQYDLNKLIQDIHKLQIQHNKQKIPLIFYRDLTNQLNQNKIVLSRSSVFLVLKNLVYMGILLRSNSYYFRGFDMNVHKKKDLYIYSTKFENLLYNVNLFMTQKSTGKIYCKNYKHVLKHAKAGDFVFLDPPYIEDHPYDFKYNKNECLNDLFLKDLLYEVKLLDLKGVKWMMTQADTPDVQKYFKKYHIYRYPVYRHKAQIFKNELLIKNY